MTGSMKEFAPSCPYCHNKTEADFVDIGVGMQQCSPYYCLHCGAVEMEYSQIKDPKYSDEERNTGWCRGDSADGCCIDSTPVPPQVKAKYMHMLKSWKFIKHQAQ